MNSKKDIVLFTDQTAIDPQYPLKYQLRKIPSDGIFQAIDQLSGELGPTPSIIEQLFSADRRDLAKTIEQAKIKAVSARMILIEGLKEHLHICLKAHESDLEVITKEQGAETKGNAQKRIKETFAGILQHLLREDERIVNGVYDIYVESVDSIEKKNLPEDMRKAAIANTRQNLMDWIAQNQKLNGRIRENLQEQLIRCICEISMC